MNNTASILVLIFLAITFIMSAHDKVFHWNDNMSWLKPHFEKTFLNNFVPQSVFLLLVIELITSILCVAGIFQLMFYSSRTIGFYGAVFSCIALLMMLFGQRLAKDYEGARNIAIYFIPAVLAVFWLS